MLLLLSVTTVMRSDECLNVSMFRVRVFVLVTEFAFVFLCVWFVCHLTKRVKMDRCRHYNMMDLLRRFIIVLMIVVVAVVNIVNVDVKLDGSVKCTLASFMRCL
jgi:hypothetical protein